MRDRLKSKAARLWLLAPLVLPSCTLGTDGQYVVQHFNPGSPPYTSAIFCDVRDQMAPPHCASAEEEAVGIPLARAAIALVNGESSDIGLDYDPAAIDALGCSLGQPVAITFIGPFPTGNAVCLNCAGVIGPVYADANAACSVRCIELNGVASDAFCAAATNARASINTDGCVSNACTDTGALSTSFQDPRRIEEPVQWMNLLGTAVSGADLNTLSRTAATTPVDPMNPNAAFDAGAASAQVISGGDGYVEFTVTETDTARVLGLSEGAAPDLDPSLQDIGFGVRLTTDGHLYVFENGNRVDGPNPDFSFTTYDVGDRVRVSVRDRFNGTAEVTYSAIPANCAEAGCEGMAFYTSSVPADYPLRVDATLREQGATLTDVRLVRIK